MRHFPIFRDLRGRRVIVSGGGEVARAKLRLLLRTEARLQVFAEAPQDEIRALAAEGRLTLILRPLAEGDAQGAALVYAANADRAEDRRVAALARRDGVLVNVVDDLEASDFITPALVDRDPVVVAIGTEGAAPVLARGLKARIEELLPQTLGPLARAAAAFRPAAESLPPGAPRRAFWARFFDREGPQVLVQGDAAAALPALLAEIQAEAPAPGRVVFVGAGPGDPELLTLRARNRLHEADVILHDRLVPQPILDLARREALFVETGKSAFAPSMPQAEIDALMIGHARRGAMVVRLKSGDPGVFGRLDEEIAALDAEGIGWEIVPGLTSAAAAAAEMGRSLTRRGRNRSVTFITAQDTAGLAEHDWRALAQPGAVTAVYMGLRAARFVQGRMLLHGADPATPVTAVENAGRPGRRSVTTTLATLPEALKRDGLKGPAVLFLGLDPHSTQAGTLPAAAEG